jgi:hypothetical protein
MKHKTGLTFLNGCKCDTTQKYATRRASSSDIEETFDAISVHSSNAVLTFNAFSLKAVLSTECDSLSADGKTNSLILFPVV